MRCAKGFAFCAAAAALASFPAQNAAAQASIAIDDSSIHSTQIGDRVHSAVHALLALTRERGRNGADPLLLIRAANLLIPLGRSQALSALLDYDKSLTDPSQHTWLFWLVRVVFKSYQPDGKFPAPGISIDDPVPVGLLEGSTYPIEIARDIPLDFVHGVILGGYQEPFPAYVKRCSNWWGIRETLLRPPDDPFQILSEKGFQSSDVVRQVLELVNTAYQPTVYRYPRPSFESYHRAFLELGCHWNERKQMYVRGDGRTLAVN